MGMRNHDDVHLRWIKVQHRFASLAGVATLATFASNSRFDLLLRQIEVEQHAALSQPLSGEGWIDDFAIALAESWVLRSYEMVRVACAHLKSRRETNDRLQRLHERLALVRMPVAKAEIRGANRSPEPIVLVLRDGSDPRNYEADGSYIIPRGLCGATGAVMWWPIDIKSGVAIEVCRRDLSDEFLALFD